MAVSQSPPIASSKARSANIQLYVSLSSISLIPSIIYSRHEINISARVLNGALDAYNLFIEKPLGMHAKGWKKLHNICKQKKLIAYIGYCHRLIPYTIKLKELIDNKIIGKIIHANLRWGSYLPDWHPWESYKNYYMC